MSLFQTTASHKLRFLQNNYIVANCCFLMTYCSDYYRFGLATNLSRKDSDHLKTKSSHARYSSNNKVDYQLNLCIYNTINNMICNFYYIFIFYMIYSLLYKMRLNNIFFNRIYTYFIIYNIISSISSGTKILLSKYFLPSSVYNSFLLTI